MSKNNCFCCKITILCIIGLFSAGLFLASLYIDYQYEMTREHVRFRKEFPSQVNWVSSPDGILKCYLFNVTNAEAFLNGSDTKLKLQEVGPIVYRIKGRNKILDQTENTLTYQKIRYHDAQFDPKASVSYDILNQTIILPNLILLGAAAKLHDWVSIVRHAFNAITINETPFITNSVYYFLWNFTTPTLDLLSSYMPNIVGNCGMLYNALRPKKEVYNVKIGLKTYDLEDFFHVNTLNNQTYFIEHSGLLKYSKDNNVYCPIKIFDAFDNSLFSPFTKYGNELTIIAGESCRTIQMKFKNVDSHLGFIGYRYIIGDRTITPNCLGNAMGIQLHSGMFDVSKCLFNDVPAAFSSPHFYGSSYNWSDHFEYLSPSEEYHETSIIIEPLTGIPIEEKYRFQSNIPMPDMIGYNKDLQGFSNMILPTFWYDYDLDDLPQFVVIMMRFQIYIIPVMQPIIMAMLIFLCSICFLNVNLVLKCIKFKDLLTKFICKRQSNQILKPQLETNF